MLTGITSLAATRKQLIESFKEAIELHLQSCPDYKAQEVPSPKEAALRHQKMHLKESIRLGGDDEVLLSVECVEL